MRVLLGGMELRDGEKPEFVQLGGVNQLVVREFPGGNTSIQDFGPTYSLIEWNGWFEGRDAFDRMYRIGNMRQAGKPVFFETEKYRLKVVIKQFLPEHRKNTYVPFSISLRRIISLEKAGKMDIVDVVAERVSENIVSGGNETSYVIKSGDTLSKIALAFYGDANRYENIYDDNRDVLVEGPHMIRPGWVIRINV